MAAAALTHLPAGGHGHHDSVTHAGLTIHKAAKWHVYTGQAFAGLMWCVAGAARGYARNGRLGRRQAEEARAGGARACAAHPATCRRACSLPGPALPTAGSCMTRTPSLRRFWIFYRFYNDFDVFVVGAAQPDGCCLHRAATSC